MLDDIRTAPANRVAVVRGEGEEFGGEPLGLVLGPRRTAASRGVKAGSLRWRRPKGASAAGRVQIGWYNAEMTSTTYALVTPSYWMDVERCQFLLETAERWVPSSVRHYLIIARQDLHLFRPMLTARTTLLVVEDIIPSWLIRVPGLRRFWVSLRTRPVKNWILQQIVKLSAPAAISEDVLLYADSDMFFIAAFDPQSFQRDDAVPLFAERGQRGLIPSNDRWQRVCAKLLGVPAESDFDINYVGQLIWWRRQNALATVERVQEVAGKTWQQAIAPLSGFSEYILYGLHSDKILARNSGHWHDPVVRTLCYWGTDPLSTSDLESFKAKRAPHHHSAMVSAKSGTPMSSIRAVFSSP